MTELLDTSYNDLIGKILLEDDYKPNYWLVFSCDGRLYCSSLSQCEFYIFETYSITNNVVSNKKLRLCKDEIRKLLVEKKFSYWSIIE